VKIIIDTNIVLSAIYRGGKPRRALVYCLETDSVRLHISEEILTEYREVLSRPKFQLSAITVDVWIDRIIKVSLLSTTIPPLEFPRDRKDAKFLALARVVSADFFITGDSDFSDAPKHIAANTLILSASDFCATMQID
jgi:putative PIN family toxin of toxin-antitoxin system